MRRRRRSEGLARACGCAAMKRYVPYLERALVCLRACWSRGFACQPLGAHQYAGHRQRGRDEDELIPPAVAQRLRAELVD